MNKLTFHAINMRSKMLSIAAATKITNATREICEGSSQPCGGSGGGGAGVENQEAMVGFSQYNSEDTLSKIKQRNARLGA